MVDTLWTSGDKALQVVLDSVNQFYEIRVNDRSAGLLVYERQGSQMTLTHTYIDQEFRGQGLATILIREALRDIGGRDVTVVNRCAVVERFVAARPEFASVLHPAGPSARS